MKFICDQMLADVGRWLRAAGYDTIIILEPLKDQEILQLALKERRLIITRDKDFIEIDKSHQMVIWLRVNGLDNCIAELSRQVPINWLWKPFSRCLTCNHKLLEASSDQLEGISSKILNQYSTFWFCPSCVKIYWEGSHAQHMREQLETWQKTYSRRI